MMRRTVLSCGRAAHCPARLPALSAAAAWFEPNGSKPSYAEARQCGFPTFPIDSRFRRVRRRLSWKGRRSASGIAPAYIRPFRYGCAKWAKLSSGKRTQGQSSKQIRLQPILRIPSRQEDIKIGDALHLGQARLVSSDGVLNARTMSMKNNGDEVATLRKILVAASSTRRLKHSALNPHACEKTRYGPCRSDAYGANAPSIIAWSHSAIRAKRPASEKPPRR